jgi:hypothetical protein
VGTWINNNLVNIGKRQAAVWQRGAGGRREAPQAGKGCLVGGACLQRRRFPCRNGWKTSCCNQGIFHTRRRAGPKRRVAGADCWGPRSSPSPDPSAAGLRMRSSRLTAGREWEGRVARCDSEAGGERGTLRSESWKGPLCCRCAAASGAPLLMRRAHLCSGERYVGADQGRAAEGPPVAGRARVIDIHAQLVREPGGGASAVRGAAQTGSPGQRPSCGAHLPPGE